MRRSSTNRSYSGSLLLGIGLVALVIVWNVISTLTPPQSASDIKAAIPEPPDDAAILIAKCGAPDTDKSSGTAVQTETRSLVYQKARVKAVFFRSESSQKWKTKAMLDPKTLKPIPADKLAKRLPCSVR